MSCYCKSAVDLPHRALVGLQYVFDVFPDNAHLHLLPCKTLSSTLSYIYKLDYLKIECHN